MTVHGTFTPTTILLALGLLLYPPGCSRRAPEEQVLRGAEPAAAQRSAPSAALIQKTPSAGANAAGANAAAASASDAQARDAVPQLPPVQRARFNAEHWVAVGDLHGDFSATRDVLQLAGLIDAQQRWSGGKRVLVQTGDQLDRGDDEQAILDFLAALKPQAKAAGGDVIVLNGNHETMNALGDFRYVTEAGKNDFEGAATPTPKGASAQPIEPQWAARAAAFLPGGKYARLLAERPVIAIVGDTLFAHGGVHLSHAQYGIDRLNQEVSDWLLGNLKQPPQLMLDETGPLWSRSYGMRPSARDCAELATLLAALGVKRMVVGHTVQAQGITPACGERVWRIDVGMSEYYGGDQVAALEFKAGQLQVLRGPKSKQALPAAAE